MSLKIKLFGIVIIITIASLTCLIYGEFGSSIIVSTVNTVRNQTYPVLIKSTQLKQLVLDSNNAIILAIDGDEFFSEDLLEAQEKFNQIVDSIIKNYDDMEIESIRSRYNEFIKAGLIEGKNLIENEDSDPNSIMEVSEMSHQITKEIVDYANKKDIEFSSALEKIIILANNFQKIFGLSGVGLLVTVGLLTVVIIFVVRAIHKLTTSATSLTMGDLTQAIVIDRKDELGVLQKSFENMRISLSDHIKNLDQKVIDRTKALEEAKKKIQDILDSISQGIFTFNFDLQINPEHSRQAEVIFSRVDFNNLNLIDLFHLNEKQKEDFEQWLRIIKGMKRIRQFKKNAKLSPIEEYSIIKDGSEHFIKIEYSPVVVDEKIKSIMVLAEDVTEKKQVERALAKAKMDQEASMNRTMALIHNDSQDLFNFVEGLSETIDHYRILKSLDQVKEYLIVIFREVHTAKSTSGTLGFDQLTIHLEELEDFLESIRSCEKQLCFEEWHKLLDLLTQELNEVVRVKEMLYKDQSDLISINKSCFEKILSQLRKGKPLDEDEIFDQLRALNAVKFYSFSEKYKKLLFRISEKLDKDILPLVIEGDMIHRDVASFVDDLISHLIRNAADHGIESRDERLSKGKGAASIYLTYELINKEHQITVRDNGRGIDSESIYQKAIAKGVVVKSVMSHEEKLSLIFQDDFSTKEEVTELSGRGVGMSAVKNKLATMNGDIAISTKVGEYTEFKISIPDHSFVDLLKLKEVI